MRGVARDSLKQLDNTNYTEHFQNSEIRPNESGSTGVEISEHGRHGPARAVEESGISKWIIRSNSI